MKLNQETLSKLSIKTGCFVVTTFFFTIVLAILQEALSMDYAYVTLPQWGPGLLRLS